MLVAGAVAGDDLARVAASTATALGRPVAIAIPALGDAVGRPDRAIADDSIQAIVAYATALIRGDSGAGPTIVAAAVTDTIGSDVVGIVAAVDGSAEALSAEDRAWLEAGAAAAAVAALMRDAQEGGLAGSRQTLLRALLAGQPADVAALVGHARRLGFDLSAGAVALFAVPAAGPAAGPAAPGEEPAHGELLAHPGVLLAEVGAGRICGLVPLTSPGAGDGGPTVIASKLEEHGMHVALSTPRRDPGALQQALREAELLAELAAEPDAALRGQEETYRLLIGVLLREAEELERLRAQTISPISIYDAEHDTELLATLQAFLAHDGSTTETAEALNFHRHTVGYRLARVHEVSGLSPYESDGRERLSLGLKAHHILSVSKRLVR
jgi:purine catabolism regulator